MGLTINDIRELYDKGHYTYREELVSPGHKLSDNYIFDEELSVRRNREMVLEHNKSVDEYIALKHKKQAELDKELAEDIVSYITEYYSLTDRQARVVERFVYQEHHSFMCDYFSYIDTFAEFAETIINCGG